MKSKRPIDQARLRRTPSEEPQIVILMRSITEAIGRSVSDVGPAFARVAHGFHPRPCYCLEPRSVAIALRRRDRKRGVRRRYPWIPVGYFDETGPPRLAPFWYRVPEETP